MTRQERIAMQKRIQGSGGMVTGKSAGDVAITCVTWGILFLVAFICLIPLWHVLMASVSDPKQIAFGMGETYKGGIVWWPVANADGAWDFSGYEYIFEDGSIFRGYLNTILYVLCSVSIGMVVNVTGGYVISRNTKLKPFLTLFVMFTSMFNGGLIPTYAVIRGLGMTDTILSVIIPGCTNAFFVVMMSNAFCTVPESTVESAKLDGAGHLRIMFQIMLPQAMTFAVVTILNSVILQWNSWMPASIYLSSNVSDLWPLQLLIRDLSARSENYLAAGSAAAWSLYLVRYTVIVASTLPILCIFPFFQKKLEKNVVVGAVKG